MKLPEKIQGKHKIRDLKICLLWDRDGLSPKEVAEKVHLTERRIQQILRTNHAFVPIDKEWEKRKRIFLLKKQIANKPNSQKDVADLLEQLRKEIEGDKPVFDLSKHEHHTLVLQIEKADDQKIRTTREAVGSI